MHPQSPSPMPSPRHPYRRQRCASRRTSRLVHASTHSPILQASVREGRCRGRRQGLYSRVLERSNDVLREAAPQLPDRCIALHAQLALGNAAARPYKELVLPEDPRALVDQRVK
jgi:hypothetical protein